jgi:hypothetical protein
MIFINFRSFARSPCFERKKYDLGIGSLYVLHRTENLKQKFTEMKLRSLIPNFSILVYVSDLYVNSHDRSAYFAVLHL